MPVDICQWRAITGNFNFKFNYSFLQISIMNCFLNVIISLFSLIIFFSAYGFTVFENILNLNFIFHINKPSYLLQLNLFMQIYVTYNIMFIYQCGDIETHPGPRSSCNLSLSYWNVSSLMAHNFSKLTQLQAFNSIHDF